ncbi:MAG: RecQ family ATP-dependent DNA helicase [Nanoarchaeota archaeon]
MEALLKQYFGYDDFRPLQKEVIQNILQKRDSFVLMPTGGGKSLCYQIPALNFDGLTLVISPLISLMKDQVDSLKTNGINAEYINSSLSQHEIIEIKNKIYKKEVKILYIAPERFALESFRNFLLTLEIDLIAIDEAHCISEWGHDFRPDYGNLKLLKTIFPITPVIALTATATKRVREDIINQLSLDNPKKFISSFNRENLNLIVMRKKNTFSKILNLIEKHKNEPSIIYCFSRKDTERIANELRENGYKALPYHAGLSNEIRKQNQDLFIKDKINIIVATIAFGMGIDKPDVRLIIHHTFSKSIEGYYQEIGRAGRDGLSSDCVLFYSRGDRRKHNFFIDQIQEETTKNNAISKLNKIMDYCEKKSCRRKEILEYFGEVYSKDNCNACDVCLEPEQEKEKMNKILGLFPEKIKNNSNETEDNYDKDLFEKLRNLRKQIADNKNVPPFIIFGDISLKEMSQYLPRNNRELLNIKGVGQQKLDDFGNLFLKVINNHIKENNANNNSDENNDIVNNINDEIDNNVKDNNSDVNNNNINDNIDNSVRDNKRKISPKYNYKKTKELILKKFSVKDIARFQKLTEGTIINHIEKIILMREKIDINYLLPSKENFEIIKNAFEKLGYERLAPVYNYFNGNYSYDEIRLVRAIIESKINSEVDNNSELNNNIKTDYNEKIEQIKQKYPNAYEPWNKRDDDILKGLYSRSISINEIAQILKRQPSAIESRLEKLGFL